MELSRHNIFELIGGKQNLFHSAVLTSYSFDPIFFESFYLPRLRQVGVTNIIVFLDASIYDTILAEYASYGLQSDKRLYNLVRLPASSAGVFHPKITMLFGEETGLLLLGSGNLTYNGNGLNDEIWNVFSLRGKNSPYESLFRNVWAFFRFKRMPQSILLNQQMKWIEENTHLNIFSPVNDSLAISINNEKFLFIINDNNGNILTKIIKLVGDEKVESITTISPFYDINGALLSILYDNFNPVSINCVYSETGIYPFDLMHNNPEWLNLYLWENVFNSTEGNTHRLHAKIVQLTLETRTILISGSANLTTAAFIGNNDEASIAIISEDRKDYIKMLGVNLDRRLSIDDDYINSLKKPERVIPVKKSKKVIISSAELIDETLSLITNEIYLVDYRLAILDSVGKIESTFKIVSNGPNLKFEGVKQEGRLVVLIDAEEKEEISNRCFILSDTDLSRFNPNKALQKFESLLETNKWKENFTAIMSYLWFVDPEGKINSSTKNLSVSQYKSNQKEGQNVSSDEFDNIRIGSKQMVLSIPDVRLVDFLLSNQGNQDPDFNNNTDELDSVNDIDNGNNEYEEAERILINKNRNIAFTESINYYSRRLRKYYDARLHPLYQTAKNFGNDILKVKPSEISVVDYSRILINIVLIWKGIMEQREGETRNFKKDFILNLGKFLIFARGGYSDTKDYEWHKCVEFHKELIVFSMLIISVLSWNKQEAISAKLLLLNLLYSCNTNSLLDMDDIRNLFLKQINESKLAVNPASISLIEKTFVEYGKFSQHLDPNDYTMVKEVEFSNSSESISFRRGYGFFKIVSLEPIHQNSNHKIVYDMSALHPGFEDIIKFRGGKKIRSLS